MLTRQREVFPLFSLLLIISIWRPSLATRQQLSILDFLLFLTSGCWGCSLVGPGAARNFLGGPNFPRIYNLPRESPCGETPQIFPWLHLWGHCGCPTSPGLLLASSVWWFCLLSSGKSLPDLSLPRYKGKTLGFRATLWVQMPPTCCVTLGKLLREADPPFPFVYKMGVVK